jgi:hypothetical protein
LPAEFRDQKSQAAGDFAFAVKERGCDPNRVQRAMPMRDAVTATPDLHQRLAQNPSVHAPPVLLADETARWKQVVAAAGIPPQ